MEINRNNTILRRARRNYNNISKRPLRVKNYKHNWILIEEGLHITWSNMKDDIDNYIKNNEIDIIRRLSKGNLSGLEFMIHEERHEIIQLLIPTGARMIVYNLDESVKIDQLINILKTCLSSNKSISPRCGDSPLHLLALWMGVQCDYTRTVHNLSLREMTEHFNTSENKQITFNRWINYHTAIKIILQSGYVPDHPINITDIDQLLNIIDNVRCDDQVKARIINNYVNSNRYNDNYRTILINHPILAPYTSLESDHLPIRQAIETLHTTIMVRVAVANYDVDTIDDLIRLGMDPNEIEEIVDDSLRYCNYYNSISMLDNYVSEELKMKIITNLASEERLADECISSAYLRSEFEPYWSTLPCDNEMFLEYLEYRGIKLPPEHKDSYSLIRLINQRNHDDIIELLNLCGNNENNCRYTMTLLRLMIDGHIDLNEYSDHPLANLLIECKVKMIKNARNIS